MGGEYTHTASKARMVHDIIILCVFTCIITINNYLKAPSYKLMKNSGHKDYVYTAHTAECLEAPVWLKQCLTMKNQACGLSGY